MEQTLALPEPLDRHAGTKHHLEAADPPERRRPYHGGQGQVLQPTAWGATSALPKHLPRTASGRSPLAQPGKHLRRRELLTDVKDAWQLNIWLDRAAAATSINDLFESQKPMPGVHLQVQIKIILIREDLLP